MARQFEIANDLWPQQAHYVGEFRKAVAGKDFFGDSGAADHLATLEHHDLFSRARKVGASDQAIVACADDDCVVLVG